MRLGNAVWRYPRIDPANKVRIIAHVINAHVGVPTNETAKEVIAIIRILDSTDVIREHGKFVKS